jgi:hypothetical protein
MLGLVHPPADGALSSEREPLGSRLRRGQILGWVVLGIIDAIVLDLTAPPKRAGLAVRAFQHAYDAGQMLAAGLFSAAAVAAWQRWGPRRYLRGWAALAVASFLLGARVLPEDLGGVAGRMPGPHFFWKEVTVGAVALAIPVLATFALALVERTPRRLGERLRLPVAVGGVIIAVTNHFVLENDYGGLHLFATWAAAIVLGIAAAVELPWRLSPRARLALLSALATASVWSVVTMPGNPVAIELRRETGSSLASWILRARRPGARITPLHQGQWFADRSALPPVAPSSPPLLPQSGPIVVIITVDALRADVVADPAHEALLPFIRALKRDSVVFADARSAATGTSASLATLFTGKYFSELYWTPMKGSPLICPHEDHSVRFTEILAARGAATVTFAALPGLLNDTGVVRGFTEERYIPRRGGWATASMVAEPLLARLRSQGPGPLFLYVHFDDAHAPYNSAGVQGTDFERYLREISVIDVEVGRIRATLSERGLDDRTAIILSADHGEAFGEHGQHYHATTVYDELLRVPLIVHVPGVPPRVVSAPVALVDVGPTVLDLMGAPTPATFMGESLTPYLRGQSPTFTRPLVAESSRGMRAMVFGDGLKVIENKRAGFHELYDIVTDPGELVDLSAERASTVAERLDVLDSFLGAHELRKPGYEAPFVR